jgi:hypothetical protein
MASVAQMAANRLNAQEGTGPRDAPPTASGQIPRKNSKLG